MLLNIKLFGVRRLTMADRRPREAALEYQGQAGSGQGAADVGYHIQYLDRPTGTEVLMKLVENAESGADEECRSERAPAAVAGFEECNQ
jgi:hypothetical protein